MWQLPYESHKDDEVNWKINQKSQAVIEFKGYIYKTFTIIFCLSYI